MLFVYKRTSSSRLILAMADICRVGNAKRLDNIIQCTKINGLMAQCTWRYIETDYLITAYIFRPQRNSTTAIIISICWVASSPPDSSSESIINVLHSSDSGLYFPHVYDGQFLLSFFILGASTWPWIRAMAPRVQIWGNKIVIIYFYDPISHSQCL